MKESWGSQLGFALAAIGSAVGLANILRFPYLVGNYGGGAFIMIYLISLVLISLPTFICEVAIGQKAQKGPCGAFAELGNGSPMAKVGIVQVITAFIVSSFYAVLAGWILGYFVESINGNLMTITSIEESSTHHGKLLASTPWTMGYHFAFMFICFFIMSRGLRDGLEKFNKIFTPLLFVVLMVILIISLQMPKAKEAMTFLFKPDWRALTTEAFLIALGQSLFTLSAGQGTMVTYGSYLPKEHKIAKGIGSIVLSDTLVSILSAVIVFSIVISADMETTGDLGLLFKTLPVVFSQASSFGTILSVCFFALVFLAAITSEISAIEPVILFIRDKFGVSRQKAAVSSCLLIYLVGVPCALSTNLLSSVSFFDKDIMSAIDYLATAVLIPLGALVSVVLVGWFWRPKVLLEGIPSWINSIVLMIVKYVIPVFILVVAFKGV